MLKIYKTMNNELITIKDFEEGVWVDLVNPTFEETNLVAQSLNVDLDYLRAPLDEEERARIENDNGQTLILVDVLIKEQEGMMNLYTTIPLAIIIAKHTIIT